jgi:transposase
VSSVSRYKRLEEGTFKLPKPKAGEESVELRASELAMILDGIDLASVKRVKRYRRDEKNIPEKEKTSCIAV